MTLILIIPLLWVLFKTKNNYIRVAIIVLLTVWFGIPTFNKWRADKLVNELCAKDGGIKVYETVTLPKERFNQWGQFDVWDRPHMKPNDEYFSEWEQSDILGKMYSGSYTDIAVNKTRIKVFRVSDNKVIGEAAYYQRGGGDPIGFWMPSGYVCPIKSKSMGS